MIGEYPDRIFYETKNRPPYFARLYNEQQTKLMSISKLQSLINIVYDKYFYNSKEKNCSSCFK